ncbi:unnamed protein product [Cladocopium goreaui]|uniref:Uncharacterized protein n=1 Tax=Cladocopium goreaui TaxID=2562237 RepID=A0A9P1FMU2_9DINO|nr:unnamed protein product [Cladocopium goreaui]
MAKKLRKKRLLKSKKTKVSDISHLPGDPLKRQAAEAILQAIDEEGVLLECLPSWHRRFKPKLGRFRKFLQTHPELFHITDIPGDCFVVCRANRTPPSFALKDRRRWRTALKRAWFRYCKEETMPNLEEFKRHLPVEALELGGQTAVPEAVAQEVAKKPRIRRPLRRRKGKS